MPKNIERSRSVESNSSDSTVVEQEAQPPAAQTAGRHRSHKDSEREEVLRKLQALISGDRLFFKKSTLGHQVSSPEAPTSNDFVESKFVCWAYDKMSVYLVVNVSPYGRLKFSYGDLCRMALRRDVLLHKLDTRYIKLMKPDHAGAPRRGEQGRARQEQGAEAPHAAPSSRNDVEALRQRLQNADFRSRPMPPGVDLFLRCRFVNKNEFVKRLRAAIRANRAKFMERTKNMRELRMVVNHNVRAYEVEMIGYLMDQDPWAYSANPADRPGEAEVAEYIQQYESAVRNPVYAELYSKWSSQAKSQAAGANV